MPSPGIVCPWGLDSPRRILPASHDSVSRRNGCHNGNTVEDNLKAVPEYGMLAQKRGLTVERLQETEPDAPQLEDSPKPQEE